MVDAFKYQIERPKKKRKKAFGENEVEAVFSSRDKMIRKGNTTKCNKCGNRGNNCRSCMGQGENEGSEAAATQGASMPSQDA
ncbi:hypothetical protein HanRHA438_Chr08g0329531 [Helianthus annuus]|nr:hypothetical protein HanRHA438_Chr08g0329531 [Helianthus annuus]